jgi:hypothetical protein
LIGATIRFKKLRLTLLLVLGFILIGGAWIYFKGDGANSIAAWRARFAEMGPSAALFQEGRELAQKYPDYLSVTEVAEEQQHWERHLEEAAKQAAIKANTPQPPELTAEQYNLQQSAGNFVKAKELLAKHQLDEAKMALRWALTFGNQGLFNEAINEGEFRAWFLNDPELREVVKKFRDPLSVSITQTAHFLIEIDTERSVPCNWETDDCEGVKEYHEDWWLRSPEHLDWNLLLLSDATDIGADFEKTVLMEWGDGLLLFDGTNLYTFQVPKKPPINTNVTLPLQKIAKPWIWSRLDDSRILLATPVEEESTRPWRLESLEVATKSSLRNLGCFRFEEIAAAAPKRELFDTNYSLKLVGGLPQLLERITGIQSIGKPAACSGNSSQAP